MATAKELRVAPIASSAANALVKRLHYSGKVVQNSQLHFGVYLNGLCEGVMSFGPSLDKRKMLGLVDGTGWNEFIELNRMAFSEKLPKNSESRAIGVAMRLIKKTYPQIKWVVSFADGTQCGDGTIYRASGFVLTSIKENSTLIRLSDGSIAANVTYSKGKHILKNGGAKMPEGAEKLKGFQFRYIYFIDKSCRDKLTVPELPFSKIAEIGAGMYKGVKREKQAMAPPRVQRRGSTDPHAPDFPDYKG